MNKVITSIQNAPIWLKPIIGLICIVVILATSPVWLIILIGYQGYSVCFEPVSRRTPKAAPPMVAR